MMKNKFISFLLPLIIFLLVGSVYIVHETQQAVIVQFGKPIGGVVDSAGLKFKLPFIQNVIRFDKRILEWDGAANEMPTKDNKYIFIDAFARWRISDALEFYKSAKNEMLAQSRLDDIIDGAVRDEIANRTMEEIVRSSNRQMITYSDDDNTSKAENIDSPKDGARLIIIDNILKDVSARLLELNMGIEIIDVQLKSINYNNQVQTKQFNRMVSEQNMIAEKYRAQGQGKKQEVLGMQQQKEKEILSNAYLTSQSIRGAADSAAVKIYADAYTSSDISRDFYNFKKSLESYSKTIDSTTQIILSTDSKYLKFLNP